MNEYENKSLEMNQAGLELKQTLAPFQSRYLRRLRLDLVQEIIAMRMEENRRSYFIHQINHIHDVDALIGLVTEMNQKQIKGDQIFLNKSSAGFVWSSNTEVS